MGIEFKPSDLTMEAVAGTLALKGQAIMASGRFMTPESLAANLIRVIHKAQPQFSANEFEHALECVAHAVTASMVLSATTGAPRRVVDEVSDSAIAVSGPSIILPGG